MKLLKRRMALILSLSIFINLFLISVGSEGAVKAALKTTKTSSKTGSVIGDKLQTSISEIMYVSLYADKLILSEGSNTNLTLIGITGDGTAVDLTLGKINYKSSDTNILKVQKSKNMIIVTAEAQGEAYIMASTVLEGKTKTSSVKIKVVESLNSKIRSTYYTQVKIAAARKNAEKYDWARKIKNAAVEQANVYVKLGYDHLWDLVTSQSVPRSYAVNQALGCPNCGKKIDLYGHYPYLSDPINDPWKIECPNCHLKFPTNDFKSYYESGRDEHGIFNPDLADKSLLVNKLYPEKGSSWGVDDGYGYVDKDGSKYTFIAYYNHWSLWYNGIINRALNSLRDAYIYTGDIKYARAGTILLDRISDVYPDMDISAYKTSNGFFNSDGGANSGKVVGCIWETELSKDLLKAYDAFFPAIDDQEIVNYLNNKSIRYGLKVSKKTGIGIKKNIENGIVRQIFPAFKKSQIRGNNGMHQSTLALAAVVIDTLPETKEWLDYDFQTGYVTKNEMTGGNILNTLVDDVDRDGNGNEASPQYNKLWLQEYMDVADILNGYDLYSSADLYKNPKFKKMFYAMYPFILTDNYSAHIGDSGYTGNPTNYLDKTLYIRAFEQYGDPILAQIVYFLNGGKTDGIRGDMFSPNPEKVSEDIKKIVGTYGALKITSTNLTGYGFSALRDGSAKIDFGSDKKDTAATNISDTQRVLWMYYGRNQGHGHFDTLNIGINAFNLDLSPDLGYPEYADDTPNRVEWVRNTIAHNTVVVDKARQSSQIVGQPKHFDDSGIVKLIDVEAPSVYPQTSLYKRTTAMIRVDDANSYIVDFFRIKGGNDHYFSFHGAEGNVVTEGLKLAKQLDVNGQPSGTLAGADIQFGVRPKDDSISGFGYTGSGFHWLNNVDKDTNPVDVFSADWKIKDTWNVYGNGQGADTDVHLRLTMLGKMNDVSLADGIPPTNKPGNPKFLKYVIAHRQGQNLDSVFSSVIEPYKINRFVDSVTPAAIRLNGNIVEDNSVKAIKVILKNGRTDYVVNSLNPDVVYNIDDKFLFKGFFGVYSERNGRQIYGYLNDGTLLGEHISGSESQFTGTIEDFTREMSSNNEIAASFDNEDIKPGDLIGKYIYVDNDGIRNAAYQIKGIKKKDKNLVTLDIGDITPIRSFLDVNNFSRGYIYDLFQNARFSIPITRTWIQNTP